jgi:ribulose-bisphosphate carboxylase large chain
MVQEYKAEGTDFQGITRQELTGIFGERTNFNLRYFEIQPGGYSSLERHVHEHVIIGARGKGILINEDREIPIAVHDVAYIAPQRKHQLRNHGSEPFGFYCIVDHERDQPVRAI